MEPLVPSVGWGVLHLYYRVDRARAVAEPGGGKRIREAIEALGEDGHQALAFSVLGHEADLGVMALGPDLARLQQLEAELADAPLLPAWSYVSLTEQSEYAATADDERARLVTDEGITGDAVEERLAAWRERMDRYVEHRLHPRLPERRVLCFYPMSKSRDGDANWFVLPFEERKRIMGGHARIGRSYAGRVLQLVTASTGLDDWEWGVTLLADDPAAIKEIVSEMRFDEASARFAIFGPFFVGLVGRPAEVLDRAGLGS